MLIRFWQWLDNRGWPQRVVGWLVRRRNRKSAGAGVYRPSSVEGPHAVGLTIANPLLSTHALLTDFVPSTFGSWRDYEVKGRLLGESQVVALIRDMRTGMELTLVLPRHEGFASFRFHRARKIRLTREAVRSALVSVRDTRGYLLAVGVLEETERAAYSKPLRGLQP